MTKPATGLTEEQFHMICNYLLKYAYTLLCIQITGVGLYLFLVATGQEDEELIYLVFAALLYSLWAGNDRRIFFQRRLVDNGINGATGFELPFRQNVIFWTLWCMIESALAIGVLKWSAKALLDGA